MAVDAVGSSSASAQNLFRTQNQSMGQDEFLKLLVTQLSNQDPLNPMDQKDFLAQLAQFSTVEGINNMQNSQTRVQAANLLGKQVDAYVVRDSLPILVSGKVTGVRWDNAGIFLSVQGSDKEIKLDEVSAVR